MAEYILVGELKSPLSISADRQARTPESLSFIPGAVLRGGIAASYLRIYGKDSIFDHVFLSGENIFPNLYPARSFQEVSRVIPQTAVSCKREPGFEKHGVKDHLFLKGAMALLGKGPEGWPDHLDKHYICSSCENDLKAYTGFWSGGLANPVSVKVDKRVIMHTGIDRLTGTVAENILFGTEEIDPSQEIWMTGVSRFTDNAREKLKALFQSPLFFGRAKTRGHGEVKLRLENPPAPALEDSLEKWSEGFKEFVGKEFSEMLQGFYFAITLQSDAILLDRLLRYTGDLDLGGIKDLKVVAAVARKVRLRGWNIAHRLPKEDEWGVEKGSVYLYRYSGDDVKALISCLGKIEEEGIGARREEGFGRIRISDPFHSQFC